MSDKIARLEGKAIGHNVDQFAREAMPFLKGLETTYGPVIVAPFLVGAALGMSDLAFGRGATRIMLEQLLSKYREET
jgi:hypothetical protein